MKIVRAQMNRVGLEAVTHKKVKGRNIPQSVPVFRTDYSDEKPSWDPARLESRFRDQTAEAREARKKAAIEKRIRKQRKRRGDL